MVERQARDLAIRVRVPIQVQIFLLKFDNIIILYNICNAFSFYFFNTRQISLLVLLGFYGLFNISSQINVRKFKLGCLRVPLVKIIINSRTWKVSEQPFN